MSKKLSKRIVEASLLAAAVGVAGGAAAQTLGTSSYPANNYAIELNYNNSASANPAGTSLVPGPITTKLGFGVSSGQNRYIRYIMSTNATFHVAVANTSLVDTTTAAASGDSGFGSNTSGSGVTVVSGGSTTDKCVVFQVTGLTGPGNAQSDVITFTSPAIDVTSNATAVSVTYTLHETATSASCTTGDNTTILNTPVAGAIATFANSIAFTAPSTYTDTADVQFTLPPALPFGGFTVSGAPADTPSSLTAGLSQISLAIATYTGFTPTQPTIADGATAITFTQLATKAVTTVSSSDGGSFAATSVSSGSPAANNVDLYTTGGCSTVIAGGIGVGTLNAGATSVTYTDSSLAPTGFAGYLCYLVTGKTAIPAGTYQASVTLTPVTNVTLESIPTIQAGAINHNGTVLQAPWFTTYTGYISRFFLTNSGSFDAPYSVQFLTESGITAASGSGATGTIAHGTTLEIDATSLVTLTGGTRATVIFNVAAPNNTIQGAYNVVNATTGSITVSPMIRPGTN